MPNTDQAFRLNWISFSTGEKRADNNGGSDLSIFIGDLALDVTNTLLYETVAGRYPSVKGATVFVDTNTGCSNGYGFVRFADDIERTRAMNEIMYGQNQFSSQASGGPGLANGFATAPFYWSSIHLR
nr:polyadenylate-binding protein RBP47-like [Tanacetum cinerariifolium]